MSAILSDLCKTYPGAREALKNVSLRSAAARSSRWSIPTARARPLIMPVDDDPAGGRIDQPAHDPDQGRWHPGAPLALRTLSKVHRPGDTSQHLFKERS